ncbi:MAG: hypothetical protein JWM59_2968 [Verrucomicrobiales bacterium]|nr:hypothetical protein [Verrucomicrobiales bacterium]
MTHSNDSPGPETPPHPSSHGHRSVAGWLMLLLPPLLLLGILIIAANSPYSRIPENARKTDTRVLCKGIQEAVTQFYGDYNRLPWSPTRTAGEDTDTDTSAAAGMIRILTGKDTMRNSRNTNYLEGMKAAKARTGIRQAEAKGSNKWVSGLVVDDSAPEAVDGWGGYYRIRMDSNRDGEVANPNPDEAAAGRLRLSTWAIVWSAGKDGKWETWGDNVKSWD